MRKLSREGRYLLLFTLCCLALIVWGPWLEKQVSGQKRTRDEIEGTAAERAARATEILSKYSPLPGPLLDAHMAEDVADNSGGWVPGPSGFYLSGVLTFPAADLPKWRELLSPALSSVPAIEFYGVLPPPAWWPPAEAFAGCEFFPPKVLTGRQVGFVALSPSAAAIYFSVVKM